MTPSLSIWSAEEKTDASNISAWLLISWYAAILKVWFRHSKGRHQNTSVETGDFLQKKPNVCWWSFVDRLHPYHMLGSRITWVTPTICCYTLHGNGFLLNGGSIHQFMLNGGSSHQPFCKGLEISRMQTFVRLPTEFNNLLLNAAGYFEVSPKHAYKISKSVEWGRRMLVIKCSKFSK